MEQDQLSSFAPSSVEECMFLTSDRFSHSEQDGVDQKTEYDHLQVPPSVSNDPNFFSDPGFSSYNPYCNPESDYIPEAPSEYNSETNSTSDPPQDSACSYESTCDGQCMCETDSKSESSNNDPSETRAVLEEIVKELYEELIIEHCFQVHQAMKLGAYIDEENVVESQIPEVTPVSNSIKCPNCSCKHELKEYKTKLGECMRLQTRKSKRKLKTSNFEETSYDNSNDGQKTTIKKRRQMKKAPRNVKVEGKSLNYNYVPKEFGAHVKKTGSRCLKKTMHPSHKQEIQTNIHAPGVSFSKSSQSYKDEFESTHIDFDTVDSRYSWTASQCNASEFSDSVATRTEKDGKIKLRITKGDTKKRKPKIESSHSSHLFDPMC